MVILTTITTTTTSAEPNIDKERKVLHKELRRMRRFYKGTTDEDDLYIRFLAAHNKQLDLLLTGARRRLQARFQGMTIEQAMQGELLRSVGTALGMLHVMVWYIMAANNDEQHLRRLYVWAYMRRYQLVTEGLGVLSGFSLRLSHQPLEDSQRQWDEAVEFYTWCEAEAPKYRHKEGLEANVPVLEVDEAQEKQKKRFAARLRALHLPKPKSFSKLLMNRANNGKK
ncbi:uncharacterized protein Z520_07019 [Fonsecaea multimorphosa CBS 102226]|uniref:Uncharacterized protein n=1 Tax=Fonsecaea multimorphosa CBS 102226 TaxID=1442371 RepID=A0A0D2IKL2_9EURO|nr:uncharacterized protein Z520_07019 [Fonsecaea multimorphosa CBS 102226]KIX97566.1 hypothetical protein Z520_07019 [Fonsecaea multimorphosa CBS 102226]OAL23523.1 hypothetical protein AYO22_06573 [Fonsecaea multimorphosa]